MKEKFVIIELSNEFSLLNERKITEWGENKKKPQMDMYAKWFEALVDLLVLTDMALVTS